MEKVITDLEITKSRQLQVKEMFLLLMDWANHELEKDSTKSTSVRRKLIENTLESAMEKSKGYMDQLKTEENMIQLHYEELDEEKRDTDTILELFKGISGFGVKRVSTEYDDTIDLQLSRFLVDFRRSSNTNDKSHEALIESAGRNQQMSFQGNKYSFSSPTDLREVQKLVKKNYF
jgi:hypothetical protein